MGSSNDDKQVSLSLPVKLLISILVLFTIVSVFYSNYYINYKLPFSVHDGAVQSGLIWKRNSTAILLNTIAEDAVHVDPNPTAPYPRVAWLMSYPNSGTSYTMTLVHRGGDQAVATNYGQESNAIQNEPLYSNSPEGPFLLNVNKTLPSKYILTKTHCGGRCIKCGPDKYMEDEVSFKSRCAQGSRKNEAYRDNKETVWYDPLLAQRSIHLIRDPFDNLVSNYHLERKNWVKGNQSWLTEKYSNDVEGFRKWCFDMNAMYIGKEMTMLPKEVVEIIQQENIPCHAHFYKYAKWHEHTVHVTEELKLPSIILFYEDYESKFNETSSRIFKFLELPQVANLPPFIVGKTYAGYFTQREREAAMLLIRRIVKISTWNLLKRYSD